MCAILIKATKENNDIFLRLAKITRSPVKILDDDEELDVLLVESIEKGMKSGKASKDEVKKFLERSKNKKK